MSSEQLLQGFVTVSENACEKLSATSQCTWKCSICWICSLPSTQQNGMGMNCESMTTPFHSDAAATFPSFQNIKSKTTLTFPPVIGASSTNQTTFLLPPHISGKERADKKWDLMKQHGGTRLSLSLKLLSAESDISYLHGGRRDVLR